MYFLVYLEFYSRLQTTVQFSLYLRNRKRVACVYGVIMHAGNVGRIREKRAKHGAHPSVLHASRVFSQPRTQVLNLRSYLLELRPWYRMVA
jgi:hypothetical protein